MGLGDAPKQANLQDIYPAGTPFLIRNAWIEGPVETKFGKRTMAKALIEPAEGGQAQEFAVWGSMAEQIGAIEDGDVPGVYTIKQDGQRWLFVPVEGAEVPAEATPEQTADEQALGVEPKAGDPGPGGAPATA